MKEHKSAKLVAPKDFDGPMRSRRCTDIIFLLLIIAGWIVFTLFGFASIGLINSRYINKGNPYQLLRGSDYMGNICGTSDVVKQLPLLWKPNSVGMNPNSFGDYVPTVLGICVSSCPLSGETRDDPYSIFGRWASQFDV